MFSAEATEIAGVLPVSVRNLCRDGGTAVTGRVRGWRDQRSVPEGGVGTSSVWR